MGERMWETFPNKNDNQGGLEKTTESSSIKESQAEEHKSINWFGLDRFHSRMESSVFRDKNLCLLTEDPFESIYKPPQSRQPWVNPVSSNMETSLPPCYPWNDYMEPPHDYWCPEDSFDKIARLTIPILTNYHNQITLVQNLLWGLAAE